MNWSAKNRHQIFSFKYFFAFFCSFFFAFFISNLLFAQKNLTDSLFLLHKVAKDEKRKIDLTNEIIAQYMLNTPDSGLLLAQKNYEESNKISYHQGAMLALKSQYLFFYRKWEMRKAIETAKKYLTHAEKINDLRNIAFAYGSMGIFADKLGDSEEAFATMKIREKFPKNSTTDNFHALFLIIWGHIIKKKEIMGNPFNITTNRYLRQKKTIILI